MRAEIREITTGLQIPRSARDDNEDFGMAVQTFRSWNRLRRQSERAETMMAGQTPALRNKK